MGFEEELNQVIKETHQVTGKGKIMINTDFFGLAWFLYFVTPIIEINGKQIRRSWGDSQFELDPGNYTIRIYFPYFFMTECGANSVKLQIEEGKSKKVTFYMPGWMLAKGRMNVIG